MTMPRTRVPLRIGVAALVVALVVAGAAVAYWSGSGNGSTRTRLGDPKTLVLSPGTAQAQLYPGGAASVAVVATNANPYTVHVRALVLDPSAGSDGFSVDDDHAACGVASLGFVAQDNGGKGWDVPPRTGTTDGTLRIDLAGALTMSTAAPSACQGAVFSVGLEATS
jgi:hypothetical protein